MSNRAYDKVRSQVEQLGGSMTYERKGYRHGAWIIRVDDKSITFEADGNRSFPQLDRLYVPKVTDPKQWDDYSKQLVPDAEAKLLVMLRLEPFTEEERQELARLIERTKWKFAWTFARTYPHEYTTKALCSSEDHTRLIDCIERHGIVERFGSTRRKYFYYEERKYWHMGEPYSDDLEKQPNVINRTWVDVRRHAENVKHVWTAEEVELQKRLWEIQLEKSTDFHKPKTTS